MPLPYPTPSSSAVSRLMRGNRGTDTAPEVRLRLALHGRGLRYRKHERLEAGGIRVRPDLLFGRARVAVFVDGCYWHRCPDHGTRPRANVDYWDPKLARNVERDGRVDEALAGAGWTVVRLWEHEVRGDLARSVEVVESVVRRPIDGAPPRHRS